MYWNYTLIPNLCVTLNRATRLSNTWKQELKINARLIADTAEKPLCLWYSGGIDSEVMVRSFYSAGIKPKVITLRFTDGNKCLNDHDIKYTFKLSKSILFQHEVIDLNIIDFLHTTIPEYVRTGYTIHLPFRHMQRYIIDLGEQLGYHCVLGGGEQQFTYKNNLLGFDFNTALIYILDYCNQKNLKHTLYFYMNTPELIMSWLHIPFIQHSMNYPDVIAEPANFHPFKQLIMYSQFKTQYRPKYDGYEQVREEYAKVEKTFFDVADPITKYFISINDIVDQCRYVNQ